MPPPVRSVRVGIGPTARHLAAAMLAVLVLSAPALADTRHLFEMIGREPYRGTWNRLIAPVLKNERWLKGARGVWSPVQSVSIDGVRSTLYVICRPGACADHRISVIFEAEGRRAYAAFRSPTGVQILGMPSDSMRRALVSALLTAPR